MEELLASAIIKSYIVGIAVGVSASFLGVFVILRRMALVGDALSHVALPGMAIAILLNINPFIGAIVFLFFAVFGIVLIEKQGILSVESLVGVFFTAALAIGTLLMPNIETLIESLFGEITKLNNFDVLQAVILGLSVIVITTYMLPKFSKLILSSDIAHSEGINVQFVELLFLLLLAVTVAIGIKIIGALLIGALVIIPASAAKNVSVNFKQMIAVSIVIGTGSIITGLILSSSLKLPPGPVVVIINSVFFLLSLLIHKKT